MELFDVQPMATTISNATLRPMMERMGQHRPCHCRLPRQFLLKSTCEPPNRARLSRFLKKLRAVVGANARARRDESRATVERDSRSAGRRSRRGAYVVLRAIRAEVVEQQERVEELGRVEPDGSVQVNAGALEDGAAQTDSTDRSWL